MLAEIEYNDFRKSKMRPILHFKDTESSKIPKGLDKKIINFEYIDFGDSILVQYENGALAVINSRRREKGSREFYEIKYIKDSSSEIANFLIECDDTNHFAVVYKKIIEIRDSKNFKILSTITIGGSEKLKQQFSVSPRGTKIFLLAFEKNIKIYDLVNFKEIMELNLPSNEPSDMKWNNHLPGTDTLIANYNPDTQNNFYDVFWFDDINPYFCHKSCHVALDAKIIDGEKLCPINLKPCSKLLKFFNTVIVTLLIFILAMVLLSIICILLSTKKEADLMDKEDELELEKLDGESKETKENSIEDIEEEDEKDSFTL